MFSLPSADALSTSRVHPFVSIEGDTRRSTDLLVQFRGDFLLSRRSRKSRTDGTQVAFSEARYVLKPQLLSGSTGLGSARIADDLGGFQKAPPRAPEPLEKGEPKKKSSARITSDPSVVFVEEFAVHRSFNEKPLPTGQSLKLDAWPPADRQRWLQANPSSWSPSFSRHRSF